MTRRGKIILGGTLALYLAGATNDSAAAYAFASALLGILLMAYVLSRLAASGLKITGLRAPDRAQARQEFVIDIEIANLALLVKPRSRLAGRAMAVSFVGEDEEVSLRLPPIPRGVSGHVELPLTLPWRGRWDLCDLRLEGSDPLGLYERREPAAERIPIIVTPAFWSALPMHYTALLTPASRHRLSALRPDQGEYRSLREYVPGDDLRRIHWRATAHRNRLMVKEFERPRDLQTQVWLAAVAPGLMESYDPSEHPASLTLRMAEFLGWADLPDDVPDETMDEGAELALSVAATLAHAFVNASLPTIVRAPGLPTAVQGPGRGGVFWRELLAALGHLPYCSDREVEAGAIRWSLDGAPGSSLHIVSNSARALATMRASFSIGEAVPSLFTGRKQDTPPWATHVASYEDIPAALTRAAAGSQMKQVTYA